jgi:uncharacterized membrane protein YkvA (DUF1232 family)
MDATRKEDKKRMKEILSLLPNLVKLVPKLLKDPRVASADKVALVAAVAYVIWPMDLIPDFIPFFGEVDDVYFLALALIRLLNRADEQVLRDNWEGPWDITHLIKTAAEVAVFFLPKRVQEILVGKHA